MKLYTPCLFVIILGLLACEPEDEKLTFDQGVTLRFSTDSIQFDTIFTSLGSVTKRLRVFNDSENAVEIANISLSNGSNSPYTIYVNGRPNNEFENTTLFGKDSLLMLVEVTIDPANKNMPFLVTDEINFETNGNLQDIKLVAWGQDAVFINGQILPCNTTWTADRPYVIYNSLLVDSLCTLNLEAGTRIYSHNGSFILVEGTINVQGTPDQRVEFLNDRFDDGFKNAPGQWGGIIFLEGSKKNKIHYADIRNAEFGVYLGTPDEDDEYDLIIGNTRIENMGGSETFMGNIINVSPGYGILAISSDLYAFNTLVNNCAINTVGNYAGGNYRYEHCTLANFSFDFFREDPSVVIADNLQVENGLLVDQLSAEFINTIIWGNLRNEFVVSNASNEAFELSISNSLIRSEDEQLNINGNILNEDPKFTEAREYNYVLDTLSPAKDTGIDIGLMTDLYGNMRDTQPDIGALERIEN